MSEISSGKFREVTTGYLPFVMAILPLYCQLGSYLVNNNWRDIVLYPWIIVLSVIFLGEFYVIETPRYAATKNKEYFIRIINKISKRNGNRYISYEEVDWLEFKNKETDTKVTYMDTFRTKVNFNFFL